MNIFLGKEIDAAPTVLKVDNGRNSLRRVWRNSSERPRETPRARWRRTETSRSDPRIPRPNPGDSDGRSVRALHRRPGGWMKRQTLPRSPGIRGKMRRRVRHPAWIRPRGGRGSRFYEAKGRRTEERRISPQRLRSSDTADWAGAQPAQSGSGAFPVVTLGMSTPAEPSGQITPSTTSYRPTLWAFPPSRLGRASPGAGERPLQRSHFLARAEPSGGSGEWRWSLRGIGRRRMPQATRGIGQE